MKFVASDGDIHIYVIVFNISMDRCKVALIVFSTEKRDVASKRYKELAKLEVQGYRCSRYRLDSLVVELPPSQKIGYWMKNTGVVSL